MNVSEETPEMADPIDTMIMLHRTISKLQSRLQVDCITGRNFHGDESKHDDLLDQKTKCLYYINLGHCYKHLVYFPISHHINYFELYHINESTDVIINGHTVHAHNGDYTFDYKCRKSYAEAALYAYDKSKELASLVCESEADPLLLLTNCLYCTHLCLFRESSYKSARKFAETVFLNAAEFTNTLGDDTLNLLQYIRDIFMASNDCPESLASLNFHEDSRVNFPNNPIVVKNKAKKHKHCMTTRNLIIDSNSLNHFKNVEEIALETTDNIQNLKKNIKIAHNNDISNDKIVTPTDSGDNSVQLLSKSSKNHNDSRYKKQNLIYKEIATAYKERKKNESLSAKLVNNNSNSNNKGNEEMSDSDDDVDKNNYENKFFLDTIRIAIRGDIKEETPLLLENLTHALDIYRALDTIFRAYVRGNALPGQLSGGHSVSLGKGLGGQALTFGTFILQGPYISWHGFIRFLLDFNIAKQPSRKSPLGKLFPRAANIEPSIRYAQAPLTMREATAIFLECSKSVSPSLTVNKYLKEYKTLLEESNKASKDEGKDLDSWNTVNNWCNVGLNQTWEINAGLNFMQFLDCLGKCGCVAYVDSMYKDALPTLKSKIQHFLTAHLGLTDPRKWKQKVMNKNKQIEETINNMKL